jgi:hypothetical protein
MIHGCDIISVLDRLQRKGASSEQLAGVYGLIKQNGNLAEGEYKTIEAILSGTYKPEKGRKGIDPMAYLKTGAELQAMEITVSWLIEDLIPDASITTVIGPAG